MLNVCIYTFRHLLSLFVIVVNIVIENENIIFFTLHLTNNCMKAKDRLNE